MEPKAPEPLVDARSARFERALIAVVLLGGFVFQVLWVIPVLAVVLAIGLGFGPQANFFAQVFKALFADRLRPPTAMEPATAVRFSELFAVAALSIATVFFALHLGALAWLVALVQAGISALHASTGVSVEAAVRERLPGHKRAR